MCPTTVAVFLSFSTYLSSVDYVTRAAVKSAQTRTKIYFHCCEAYRRQYGRFKMSKLQQINFIHTHFVSFWM